LSDAELSCGGKADAPDEQNVYNKLLDNFKKWNIEFGQRLTVWYKKRTRLRLFWLGLLLALLFNVDSIQLFTLYSANATVRQQVISFYDNNGSYLQLLAHKLDTLPEQAAKTKWPQKDSIPLLQDSLRALLKQYQNKISDLGKTTNLPIGFTNSVLVDRSHLTGFLSWMVKFLGLIASAFAASFGAPFWFDILKKAYSLKPKS
jgi:hypothetical protein